MAAIYFFGEYARLNFPIERNDRIKDAVNFCIEKKLLSSKNKSGYRGVSWHEKRKMIVATTSWKRKTIIIGYFNDPKEAAIARDKKVFELRGDKALFNFPEYIKEYRKDMESTLPIRLRYTANLYLVGVCVNRIGKESTSGLFSIVS